MTTYALVLAGGTGTRFGAATPKQLLDLDGRSILEVSAAALATAPGVDAVVIVAHPDCRAVADEVAQRVPGVVAVVDGGDTRADSTRRGLAAVDAPDDALVLVHDAARPLVSQRVVADCLAALRQHDAVTPALESTDTLLEVDSGDRVVASPPRDRLRRVQTPQGFRLGVLRRAHAAAAVDPHAVPTDDVSVVLAHEPGASVVVVPGEESNLKITRPDDLERARQVLAQRRVTGEREDA